MTTRERLMQGFAKPLIAAGIAGGVSMLTGNSTQLNFMGMQVSSTLAVAGAVGVGQYVSEIGHEAIFPLIPGNEKYNKLESAIYSPAIGAGTAVAIMYIGGADFNWAPLAAVGAGSVVAADYLYDNTIDYSQGY